MSEEIENIGIDGAGFLFEDTGPLDGDTDEYLKAAENLMLAQAPGKESQPAMHMDPDREGLKSAGNIFQRLVNNVRQAIESGKNLTPEEITKLFYEARNSEFNPKDRGLHYQLKLGHMLEYGLGKVREYKAAHSKKGKVISNLSDAAWVNYTYTMKTNILLHEAVRLEPKL